MLYQQGAPVPPKRSSPLFWILPLASLGLLLVVLAMAAFVRSCARSTEGDVVEAQADSGELIKFAIAPLNGGASFISALEIGWKRKRAAEAGSVAP